MKANEIKVDDFLGQNKANFVIPVYQRNYDWTTSQCEQLLDDILEAGRSKNIKVHFIGSIVYVHDDIYTSGSIKEFIIIDGQQRLTTLTLIYLLIYKLAKNYGNHELANEIYDTILINKYVQEGSKLKLKPTDNHNEAYEFLLSDEDYRNYDKYSRLIGNFQYFYNRVNENNYITVLKGLRKLMFVEISLDRSNDDAQRIFESLNSTGLELSQSDLIRNYVLMGLRKTEQNNIYKNYWEIIEKNAKDEINKKSKVSDFIRDYMTLKNGVIPNKDKVYQEFKKKYEYDNINDLKSILEDLKSIVYYYNKLINPNRENDKDIRIQLEYINRLEINVSYPFLMQVYKDYDNGILNKNDFLALLNVLQSYIWRRFIAGLPTNALNKIFMSLYEKIDKNNYLFSFQKALIIKKGVQRFPSDKEVKEVLKTKDMYNIKSKNRMYFFEKLENYDNKEKVFIDGNKDITIEHIFPQSPDSKWKLDLSLEDYSKLTDEYLNTVGNLTLSGNNGKLGNKSFIEKKKLKDYGYIDSRLWLNRYLSEIDKWGIEQLNSRFKIIFDRLLKIWEYPIINIEEEIDIEEVNIFDAETPTHKKLEYAIFFDKKLYISEVSKLYVEVIKQLFDLQPETFFNSELGEKIGLSKDSSIIRSPSAINDLYYIETNLDNNGKFERIKLALSIFGIEDELVIKYSDS